MGDDFDALDPNLRNIVENQDLRWVFVGGKGGVGKTTTSSSIAALLAHHRESVLLVSTDPAHNLSDAFEQQFGKNPTLVNGFDNLFAMEIDPTDLANMQIENIVEDKYSKTIMKELGLKPGQNGMDALKQTLEQIDIPGIGNLASFAGIDDIQELISSAPGIDEAMSFLHILKLVRSMKYSTIVFDTAPTGHTLRLLALPKTFEKTVDKVFQIKNRFEGMIKQVGAMIMPSLVDEFDNIAQEQFDEMKSIIENVTNMFKDEKKTTFICVCIPEMLSLYETERLIQELMKFEMNVDNIVVNQILFPPPDSKCYLCNARSKMQQKQLDQVRDLYCEDFHVVHLPLLPFEVRGVEKLKLFSKFLVGEMAPEDAFKMVGSNC